MADDLYSVLGVSRQAGQDDIKRRYRQLAKALHPDLNPGDDAIAERFKRVSAAHAILADPRKRARYDLGEIDEAGQPRQQYGYHRGFGAGGGGRRQAGNVFDDATIHDLFAEMFGHAGAKARGFRTAARGDDLAYTLDISFLEAARGARKRVVMGDGRTLDLGIPAGIQEGQTLRLRGKGRDGAGGGPAGDALVEIQVAAHPLFERRDLDIHLDLPVSLTEAALGARVDVPTIDGPVTMAVPKGANSGTTLRLKGRGIAGPTRGSRGDQYVRLRVMLPKTIDADLAAFLDRWSKDHPYDPRRDLPGEG